MTEPAAKLLADNPFPGLRAFEPSESDRFFGRRQQVDALVAQLATTPLLAVSGASGCGKSSLVKAGLLEALEQAHEVDGQSAWLPVVMRPGQRPMANLAQALAAALPRLADHPGPEPLEDGGANSLDARAASLLGQLRLGGLGLVEVVRLARLPANARVLLVVDQFEELFRFRRLASLGACRTWGVDSEKRPQRGQFLPDLQAHSPAMGQKAGKKWTAAAVSQPTIPESGRLLGTGSADALDVDEASAFVKLLLQAAADPGSPVSVVLTLRSDTLGGCADFAGLAEVVSAGSVLVPRLSRNQRKQAITGPVALRGQRIAPRLVQRLLNDVSDDFDDLPVMQHALSRTWQHWAQQPPPAAGTARRPIDLEDYLAVGGASDALARHADEARQSLGPLGEPGGMLERAFRALTERTAEGTALRRPLPWLQLRAVCAGDDATEGAALRQVVERFRRADTAFLLPGSAVPLDSNPLIDISHESLIRQWPLLRAWVVAESQAQDQLHRLVHDARAHADAAGELWRGRNLALARDWQRRNRPTAGWVQLASGGAPGSGAAALAALQEFLDKSAAAQQQEQRRAARYRWGLVGLGAAVVLVSLAAAFNGWSLQRQARSGELAARAILDLDKDPARSASLALKALDQHAGNDRAEYALRQAMATLEVARTLQIASFDAPVTEARYTPDQRRLVVAGGSTVWRLDARTLAVQATLAARGPVLRAWELNQALFVVHSTAGVHVQAADGSVRADLSCPAGAMPAAISQFLPASAATPAQLAVGCGDGGLKLWTLAADGKASDDGLAAPQADPVAYTALGFSADGRWLATGDADGRILIWQRGSTQKPWIGALRPGRTPLQHDAAVRDVSFSRLDPSLLASASDDRSSRVWSLDFERRNLVMSPDAERRLRHERSVSVARFVEDQASPDDLGRLMTVSDKRVLFWSDDKTHDERLHDDWVSDASVSDSGELLVSASQDGTARVWSSRTTVPVAVLHGHRNEVTHALFGPDGQLVTTSRDRTLRLWQLQAPRLLAAGKPWQTTAALDTQGKQWVLCGEKDANRVSCRLQPAATAASAAPGAGVALGEIKPGETLAGASLSADGSLLLAQRGSHDLQARQQPVLWRLADRNPVKLAWLAKFTQAVFNPRLAEWLALGQDGSLTLWPQAALSAADPPAPLWQAAPQAGRSSAVPSPDGRWIAVAQGAVVQLFDRQAAAAAAPRLLAGHLGDVRSLAFSSDSQALVSASADRSARVWRVADTSAPSASVLLRGGHSAALASASFSPDGAWVVTASADNSVRVWDARLGLERAALYRHAGAVNQAIFDASGEWILSLSDDGTAVLGRCDACRMPLDPLRQRARESVRLAPDEQAALAAERSQAPKNFLLPR